MEFWFTYTIYNQAQILRIGKGHCFAKCQDAAESYLHSRYGYDGWNHFGFRWHVSESAALKSETKQLEDYVAAYGVLPSWNSALGGGGRQIYHKCKAVKSDINLVETTLTPVIMDIVECIVASI